MIGRTNVGGGGEGLKATDAILRVIAPAGSTVTISKGGVSKSDQGHENASDTSLYDYYFIIHASQFDSVNPWTVTATLGALSASDTVTIDTADEYDVLLGYWNGELYDNGNQWTSVTGGWSATYQGEYVTFQDSTIEFTQRSGGVCLICTELPVSLYGYSTLKANISVSRYSSSGNTRLGIANTRITADNAFLASTSNSSTGTKTMSLNISGYSDAKYIVLSDYGGTTSVSKIWME